MLPWKLRNLIDQEPIIRGEVAQKNPQCGFVPIQPQRYFRPAGL